MLRFWNRPIVILAI